jgi:hypothetical protein
MFRLMRNTHLIFGLAFFFMSEIFAISSLVIMYRPWLPNLNRDDMRTVSVGPEEAATPRALALHLMLTAGLLGDLRQATEQQGSIRLVIARPGTQTTVEYSRATGEAQLRTRRFGIGETFVQLHVNHGFWHGFLPANLWSLLSLLGSIALFLLGASGTYLWFSLHDERIAGAVVLIAGLAVGLGSLIFSRVA